MSISGWFIARPVGTGLLAAAVVLAGLAAYPTLPVAPLPQVDFPTIQVSAGLPGASADVMASNVAAPLERQLAQISGLTQMTSNNVQGNTSITLQFSLDRNIDAAAQDVQSAISAALGQLPTNLPSTPSFRKINPADAPILVIALTSKTLPLDQVSDYADNILAQRLSQVPGVGLVNVNGSQKPAVRIQIDPARAAAVGLSFEDIRAQLSTSSENAPKGTVSGDSQTFSVRSSSQLVDAKPWNDVVVAWRNGAPVRVSDLGAAVAGVENVRTAGWAWKGAGGPKELKLGQGRAILLSVTKQPGSNVISTVQSINALLPTLMQSVPDAIEAAVVSDRTQTIQASVRDIEFTLLLSVGLVVMVIYAFLGSARATLVPAVMLPLALLATVALMKALGFSLDNLSLMALTIAVGFVVDDAIVMMENIYAKVEAGKDAVAAAMEGAGEIGFTLASITLSLIAVFIPVMLMGGVVGRLLQEFAFTMVAAIAASLVLSLTVTPAMCAYLLPRATDASSSFTVRLFEKAEASYERLLGHVLRHPLLTGTVFLASVAATAAMYVFIPKGFFPQQDTGFVAGIVESGQETSFQRMQVNVVQAAKVIADDPDVAAVNFIIGSRGENSATFFLTLRTKEAGRTATSDEVIRRLRPKLAEYPSFSAFLQSTQDLNVGGRVGKTQYQYTLTSAYLDELNTWSPKLLAAMAAMPELADVTSDQASRSPIATFAINRDAAARYGISVAAIDFAMYNAVGQRQVSQYFTQLNSYHVILEATPSVQSQLDFYRNIYLTSPLAGKQVPLSELVRLDASRSGPSTINHQGQFPAVTLSFNLAPGVSLGQAVQRVQAARESMQAPGSLSGSFQGTAQAFQDSLSSQPLLILAALLCVYVILGVLYESLVHPVTIVSTLPSAGLGALVALWLGGQALDVVGMIAILLLIGIVKKNGIMVVDVALTLERSGVERVEAVRQACVERFRPILMTTMCALFAGIPLMVGTGTGTELRKPLGLAIVGGLLVSQLLTLFTTPVVYLYMDRLSSAGKRLWSGRHPSVVLPE